MRKLSQSLVSSRFVDSGRDSASASGPGAHRRTKSGWTFWLGSPSILATADINWNHRDFSNSGAVGRAALKASRFRNRRGSVVVDGVGRAAAQSLELKLGLMRIALFAIARVGGW